MTRRTHEPLPRIRQDASVAHADWSYQRLTDLRQAAARVRDSGFLWTHERTHVEEVIDRIDATVSLKRERDRYQAGARIGKGL
ncbi:MAG TPA: hypothetical protein VNF47_25625 [Streptosporangiaceae bacterium]|nr:hypothetical protein [Streptosporangiaceae bacterium]